MPEKEYQNIKVEVEDDLGLVFLNRPNALNALSSALDAGAVGGPCGI